MKGCSIYGNRPGAAVETSLGPASTKYALRQYYLRSKALSETQVERDRERLKEDRKHVRKKKNNDC